MTDIIRGPQGATGTRGPQGRQGVKGVKGDRGVVGTQGIPGMQQYLTVLAGENLGGNRVVYIADGRAFYADSDNLTCSNASVGITNGASVLDDIINIQTSGYMQEPSWQWSTNLPLFLGVNGLLTQTMPSTGFSQIIGIVTSSIEIIIQIQPSIILG